MRCLREGRARQARRGSRASGFGFRDEQASALRVLGRDQNSDPLSQLQLRVEATCIVAGSGCCYPGRLEHAYDELGLDQRGNSCDHDRCFHVAHLSAPHDGQVRLGLIGSALTFLASLVDQGTEDVVLYGELALGAADHEVLDDVAFAARPVDAFAGCLKPGRAPEMVTQPSANARQSAHPCNVRADERHISGQASTALQHA